MKQKRILLALWLSASIFYAGFAQSLYQKSYSRAFFEQTVAVETLPNGHLVMAGFAEPVVGGPKSLWAMRVNAAGDVVWSKSFDPGLSCSATALQKTTDGNLLLTYNTYGATPVDRTSGWMKLSSDGAIIWSKKAIGNSILTNISPAAGGGYLLCGQNITAVSGKLTGLVVRIGEDGALQWSSVFGENGSSAVADCWEDSQGFIHCTGYTNELGGDRNGFWAKLGPNGQLVGPVRRFGSSSDDELVRIVPMGADRLLMCGYSHGFNNSAYTSVWTVETDLSGELKASKLLSLPEKNLVTNDLIALPGDQFMMALGILNGQLSPAILTKLSIDLDQLFTFQYKGGSESDAFLQVVKTSSGFAAVGGTYHNGDANAYLVSLDANGKLNNDDCCPLPLDIARKDVTPETASFVPTQTAFYSVQNAVFAEADQAITTTNLCQPIELEFSVSKDTICPGECVDIMAIDSTIGVTYTFEYQGGALNPDVPGQVCHTQGPVLFITRKGANNNCEKSLTKRVVLGSKADNFPNAFTPNGDGANDLFRPVFDCPAATMHLEVYNRWGHKVFDTTEPTGGWDGKTEGIEAASDIYVWKLEYEVENNGSREKFIKQGEVTLLR